jgi:hypothetical protein
MSEPCFERHVDDCRAVVGFDELFPRPIQSTPTEIPGRCDPEGLLESLAKPSFRNERYLCQLPNRRE